MTKLFSLLVGAALLGGVAVASAAEPVTLNDSQMDRVAAGLLNFGSLNFAAVGQVAGSAAYAGNSAINVLTSSAAVSSAGNNAVVTQY